VCRTAAISARLSSMDDMIALIDTRAKAPKWPVVYRIENPN
jgi:hypothetical protein